MLSPVKPGFATNALLGGPKLPDSVVTQLELEEASDQPLGRSGAVTVSKFSKTRPIFRA